MHASDPSWVESKTRTLSRRDGLVLAIFAIAGSGWALYAYHCLMPAAIQWAAYDFWFDADIPWLYRNFTERWMSPTATSRHPLLMLVTLPWGYTVGIGPLLGLAGAFTLAGFFVTLRWAGLRLADASLFTAVLATSSGFLIWAGVPESFPLAGATVVAACMVAAHPQASLGAALAANVLTLGVTITNWMVGLLASWASLRWRRTAVVAALTVVLVFVGGLAQRLVAPHSDRFLLDRQMLNPSPQYIRLGPVERARVFLVHSVVLPRPARVTEADAKRLRRKPGNLTVEEVSATPLATAWVALLAVAVYSAWLRRRDRLVQFASLALIGQICLHLVFGIETFLYSPHFVPLLVLLCSLASLGKSRKTVITLAVLVVIISGTNNLLRFHESVNALIAYVGTR